MTAAAAAAVGSHQLSLRRMSCCWPRLHQWCPVCDTRVLVNTRKDVGWSPRGALVADTQKQGCKALHAGVEAAREERKGLGTEGSHHAVRKTVEGVPSEVVEVEGVGVVVVLGVVVAQADNPLVVDAHAADPDVRDAWALLTRAAAGSGGVAVEADVPECPHGAAGGGDWCPLLFGESGCGSCDFEVEQMWHWLCWRLSVALPPAHEAGWDGGRPSSEGPLLV